MTWDWSFVQKWIQHTDWTNMEFSYMAFDCEINMHGMCGHGPHRDPQIMKYHSQIDKWNFVQICGLCNDNVCNSDKTTSNGRMISE